MATIGEFFIVLLVVASLLSTAVDAKDKDLYCGGKFPYNLHAVECS